jgi:hypothetical protein|tara:strand:+ start:161 stop:361 length:201 start_codon:yes stop_codon:yes gene_type:complete
MKYRAEVAYTGSLTIEADSKEEAHKKIEVMNSEASITKAWDDSFFGINHIDSVHTYVKETDRFIAA